ncbi:MAG TPA: hypothetical protein VJX95_02340 [Oscillospiraceae bacterium]|nr:hypothetical protein [Oscillospiraceae bacterium]
MRRQSRKYFWVVGIVVSLVAFVLLLVAIGIVLQNDVGMDNLLAFLIASVIFGAIAALIFYLRATIALTLYLLGIGAGFVEMYRIFYSKLDGWGDLIGLASLWTWSAIGLIAGVVVQLLYYLYKKYIRRR